MQKFSHIFLLTMILFILLCLSISQTLATTYYVSTTGSNSYPGTKEQPWASPGYASRQIHSGDCLVIKGGRYSLSQFDADIIMPPSGCADAWVTIMGETGNRPILAGSNNLLMAISLANKNYVRIENLEITSDNGALFRDGIAAVGGAGSNLILKDIYIHHLDEFGIDFGDVENVQILNCDITYCGFGSIGGPTGVSGGWRNVLIQGCDLSYNGHYYQGGSGPGPYDRPDGFGIEPSSGPIEIAYSTAEHNRGDGIDSKAENTNIHDCIVANNFADGIKLWGTGSKIENCLIYGRGDGNTTTTPWAAIVIDTDGSNSNFEIINVTVDDYVGKNYLMYVQYDHPSTPINLVSKNTIYSSRGSNASIFLAGSVNRTFEYNLFYFPNSASVLIHGGTSYDAQHVADIGSGNLYGDPFFITPAFGSTGNYHLQDGSSAIDAGISTGAPSKDLDGRNRPQGDKYDIGCYESDSAVPVELTSFSATVKKESVELCWETVSESNNYGFEIQKGKNPYSLEKIGFVSGKGTITIPQQYYFVDFDVNFRTNFYRLKQLDNDGFFKYSNIAKVNITLPNQFYLGQNYPNPFNCSTKIRFDLPRSENVQLKIFNINGRLIETLIDSKRKAGTHELNWITHDLPTGIYFCQLKVGDRIDTRKLILQK